MATKSAETISELLCAESVSVQPDDLEERRYVAKARNGDKDAIDWLLERYRDRAVRLAAHVLRRPGDAEDVAQEAFVRAFRNLSGFREEGRFYTWLYQIVVRICLDRQSLWRWRTEVPFEIDTDRYSQYGRGTETVVARVLVESLLDRLKPSMRAMLVLRELEGLDYEEIAQVLNIPVGRVKWRLHAARQQFQKLWRQVDEETDSV